MNKGFTLVELMVVMGIILILTLVVVSNYGMFHQDLALERASGKLSQDIRRAEEMSMSIQGEAASTLNGYGIYLKATPAPQTSYILFADKGTPPNHRYDAGEEIETISFEKGVKIKNLDANHLNIIFYPPDPTVYLTNAGGTDLGISQTNIVISLLNDDTKERTVTVSKSGMITGQ